MFWDTPSCQSFVIPLLAAIISLLIIPLIVVSHVPLMFSDRMRLMEFNNRVSPLAKLNAFMTFVCCRYTKIWNWFEDIQYIPRFMNILLFVVRCCGLLAFDFIENNICTRVTNCFSAHERVILCLYPDLWSNSRNKHKITLEWAHKQFVTRVHTLFYFLHDIMHP